jgi:hypothetical protein
MHPSFNDESSPNLQMRPARKHDHVVRFYNDDVTLIGEWADYIGTALSCGSSVVVIATRPHLDGISARLAAYGVDVPEAIAEDRYLARNATEAFTEFFRDGEFDETRFYAMATRTIARAAKASREENHSVVAFGEMVALLWKQGHKAAAIGLERLWNTLAVAHSFTLRCGYPANDFRDFDHQQPFLDICAEHSVVILDVARGPFSA